MNEQDPLTELRRVLDEYAVSRDAVPLLNDRLRSRANQLISLSGIDRDEALATVGLLHWHRFLLMPSPDDEADLDRALALFAQISKTRQNLLPAPICQLLASRAAKWQQTGLVIWNVRHWALLASDTLAGYRENPDPQLIDTAVTFLVRARTAASGRSTNGLRALRPNPADTVAALRVAVDQARAQVAVADTNPQILCHLCLMLYDLYELSGSVADLEEAVRVARTAATCSAQTSIATPLLTSCCLVLLCSFRSNHDRRILAEAIRWLEEAIDATQSDEG
ncbi:hypothetical protein OG780_11515 [Streptomyces sp. NBC_00386]|uniref:hypothetical protein n=1 Tax=Streptomyces sp. NBC_00386 TaxID=2975734 RepID=UPI002E1DA01E